MMDGIDELEFGYWILDIGYWMLDIGCWILDAGYRSEVKIPIYRDRILDKMRNFVLKIFIEHKVSYKFSVDLSTVDRRLHN
jgi:hypothetical protein